MTPTLAGLHCGSVFTCLLVAIYRNFEMSAFKYFTKIDLVHEACYEGYCAARVQCRRPGAKTPEVKALVATYSGLYFYPPSTAGRSQVVQICMDSG